MWQLLCAKNRHAHATRRCDRHGIQLGEDPLTTCRQPPMLQLVATCSLQPWRRMHIMPPLNCCEGTWLGARIGTLPCSQATAASASWSGDPLPLLLCSLG